MKIKNRPHEKSEFGMTIQKYIDSQATIKRLNAMLRVKFWMQNDGVFMAGNAVGKQNLTMHAMRNLPPR